MLQLRPEPCGGYQGGPGRRGLDEVGTIMMCPFCSSENVTRIRVTTTSQPDGVPMEHCHDCRSVFPPEWDPRHARLHDE
jgi:hypothetical protein